MKYEEKTRGHLTPAPHKKNQIEIIIITIKSKSILTSPSKLRQNATTQYVALLIVYENKQLSQPQLNLHSS
jgi:hypothetical protein